MGIPITGILYNVLVKAKLQQGKGETEEEYQARRAELLAKSKTGKTTAKRRMPETDEEFQQRLAEKYADPDDAPSRDALSVARPLRHSAQRTLGTDPGLPRCAPPRGLLPEHRVLLQLPAALPVLRALPLQRQPEPDRQLLPARRAQRRTAGAAQRNTEPVF